MVFNETVVTGVVTLVLGFFGKGFWDMVKNRDTIKGQLDCKAKIAKLEKELAEERTQREVERAEDRGFRKQTNTAVTMLLNIFEVEYGKDSKYKSTIEEVRKYLIPRKKKNEG